MRKGNNCKHFWKCCFRTDTAKLLLHHPLPPQGRLSQGQRNTGEWVAHAWSSSRAWLVPIPKEPLGADQGSLAPCRRREDSCFCKLWREIFRAVATGVQVRAAAGSVCMKSSRLQLEQGSFLPSVSTGDSCGLCCPGPDSPCCNHPP